jgi:hypothetical protein
MLFICIDDIQVLGSTGFIAPASQFVNLLLDGAFTFKVRFGRYVQVTNEERLYCQTLAKQANPKPAQQDGRNYIQGERPVCAKNRRETSINADTIPTISDCVVGYMGLGDCGHPNEISFWEVQEIVSHPDPTQLHLRLQIPSVHPLSPVFPLLWLRSSES